MRFLRRTECFVGVFQRFPGMFVARQMIFFAVVHRSRTVRVRRLLMKFRRSLVRIVGHGASSRKTLFVLGSQAC
jgi:hypothetical protein